MIDFFYSLKFGIGCNKLCSAWNHLINFLFNKIYPIYCKGMRIENGLNKEQRSENVIVSLTSFPARLNVVHYGIRALLCQTYKPDRIILWLTEEECKDILLPKELTDLCEYGLEIKYAPENLKPHNKLYYTLRENPNSVVISVDDDNVYSLKIVERLMKAHEQYPDCVCCNMAHEITLIDGRPDKYDAWNGGAIGKSGISDYFVALGVGGVLYPAGCFDDEYFNRELIRKLALSADDLWLKFTELRLGIKVLKIEKHTKIPFVIRGSQKISLSRENNGQKKNDVVMANLCRYYQIDWENLTGWKGGYESD